MRITTLLAALLLNFTNGLLADETSGKNTASVGLPDFSWDTVPLYMHVRKDTAYTQEEIDYLATFPLLTFEKSNGHRDSGSTEEGTLKAARAVKAVRPETKILYYRNVIVEYGGYAASKSLEEIADPFLVGESGKKKLIRNRLPAYDLSNKAVRDWWVSSAEEVCADPAIDGVFLDGVVKVVEQGYLRREIGREKKHEVLSGYTRLVKETREMLGPNKMMVANVLRARFPDSGLSYMRNLDGSYIEGFEGAVGGMSREDYVAKGMEAFQKAAQEGSLIAFTCRLGENLQDADEAPEARKERNKSVDENKRANYLLAMFLVCAEEHSYFCLHDGYDAKTSKLWLARRPEFDRPLGPPQGPATREGYRFSRDFAHASVRFDIEKEEAEIVWKKPAPEVETKKRGKQRQFLETGGERKLDQVYKKVQQKELALDLYYPTANREKNCPVVIYTHGGGWAAGSKLNISRGAHSQAALKLLEAGFCVASVDYRLCKKEGEVVMRDCVIDCKDAVRYLAKNADSLGLDSQRFFAFGDSAGGQIAQMILLSDPEVLPGDPQLVEATYRIVAGVSYYGPCDFEKEDLFNHDDRPGFRDRFGARILGPDSKPADKLKLYREMSPVRYLEKDSPPLLMIQGDSDTTIPVKHAHYMKEKADEVRAPVEVMIIKNSGHNWRRVGAEIEPGREEIVERTVQFFIQHLKEKE